MDEASLPELMQCSFSRLRGILESEFRTLVHAAAAWQEQRDDRQSVRSVVVPKLGQVADSCDPGPVTSGPAWAAWVESPAPLEVQSSWGQGSEEVDMFSPTPPNALVPVVPMPQASNFDEQEHLALQELPANSSQSNCNPENPTGLKVLLHEQRHGSLIFQKQLSGASAMEREFSEASPVVSNGSCRNSLRSLLDRDGRLNFQPHECFTRTGGDMPFSQRVKLRRSTTRAMSRIYQDFLDDSLHEVGWKDWLVVHPDSTFSNCWLLMGGLLIWYDFVLLPLQLCSEERLLPTAGPFVAYVMRIYWTVDVAFAFVTGYYDKTGKLELSYKKMARGYLKTWFTFDIALVASDWATISAESLDAGSFLRIMRMLRLLRLARLVEGTQKILVYVTLHVRSDGVLVVVEVIKVILTVLTMIHPMACFWYATGSIDPVRSWIQTYSMKDESVWFRYITSCHWAMSQLTGDASLNPQNAMERTYATFALLTAFVMSALIVSSLTTLMTRIQLITAHYKRQVSILQRYLMDNNVSTRLATRILDYSHMVTEAQRQSPPEPLVELLTQLSVPMQIELHYEMYSQTLIETHPFFAGYNRCNPAGMRQVCHTTLRKVRVSPGDVIFGSGEVPEEQGMFIVASGQLIYSLDDDTSILGPRACVCEASLWTNWAEHIGALHAITGSEIFFLAARPFAQACEKFQTSSFYAASYARGFVQALNQADKTTVTEVFDQFLDVESIAVEIFGNHAVRHSARFKRASVFVGDSPKR